MKKLLFLVMGILLVGTLGFVIAANINILPTAYTDTDAIGTNPANAYDGSYSTFAEYDLETGAAPGTLDYHTYTNAGSGIINNVSVVFVLLFTVV